MTNNNNNNNMTGKYLISIRGFFLVFMTTFFFSCNNDNNTVYELNTFQLQIDSKGVLTELQAKNDIEYSLQDHLSYLVSLKLDSTIFTPVNATFSNNNSIITLDYKNDIRIEVKAITKKKHITFEVISISDDHNIDALIWGPYYTSIKQSIGETIGIVQNDDFTFGLQALNIKTLGGYPWNDHDHLPQLDIFRQSDFNNMVREEGNKGVLYSVEAAKPFEDGSSLQAYTRNRKKDRIIENWRHERFVAPAYDDGGIVGSKIALFGCLTNSTISTIGEIEIEEGLPHPEIDGEWVKTSPVINSSYLIMDFTEANIDECIKYVKKSGFKYMYHGHPFASWGHFPLIEDQFPNAWDGMKNCVDKAEKQGIYIGTHFLTNFITTNDTYVSPIPDKRLALVGGSSIVENIDDTQTEIEIKLPDFFNQFKNNHLKSIVINEEIIRYGSISESKPWILTGCVRGVFGTKASSHLKGTKIEKLFDHGYKVFLGNADLNKEIAENIADFMNQTGVRMIDFDGLEGAGSTGMGNYGEVLFAKHWYNQLNDNLKNHFLLGASRPGHYFWHYYSRMNWGEPWYAGFRESQTQYRLDNQKYFKRNLMPGMLGWFKMTPSTTVEDIAWLMARSAGYDAGFAFVTDLKTLKENGNTEEIFRILNTWETARLGDLFTEAQKEKLQDIDSEFNLETTPSGDLYLTQVYSYKLKHQKKVRQPGEPLFSTFNFENKGDEQALSFIITAVESDISDIKIEIDNHKTISIPIILKNGNTLKITEQGEINIYDQNWNVVSVVSLNYSPVKVDVGSHSLTFDCSFKNTKEKPLVKIELILRGKNEQMRSVN